MKLRHVMTAALAALVLSCQGPAAVLAQAAAANAPAAAIPQGDGHRGAPGAALDSP